MLGNGCGLKQEGEMERHLRKQLALIVRNIQWSYAIFWSISTRQPGVLEWNDGYYNGDIKTRKTTQPTEPEPDQWGLQRSLQLRELYISLSAGDSNQQPRRPCASLSPEDLTDSEWYYLVCMSFTFSNGQGLPGRTLSSRTENWLCNAHFADSKIFSRSLLAKSASIQTLVCFPSMGGVVELGTTELVLEDPDLIKQITSLFWELPEALCYEPSATGSPKADEVEGHVPSNINEDVMNTKHSKNLTSVLDHQMWLECGQTAFSPTVIPYGPEWVEVMADRNNSEEPRTSSPGYSSNGYGPDQYDDDCLMMDRKGGTFDSQSVQSLVDKFDNGPYISVKPSDCISQSLVNSFKVISFPQGERISCQFLRDLQECNLNKFSSLDPANDDLHYIKTLSAILKVPRRKIEAPSFLSNSQFSCFMVWKKSLDAPLTHGFTKQKMLKKVLFDVVWKHNVDPLILDNRALESGMDNIGLNNLISERRIRKKLNEKFIVLKSLVPSVKVDKASILEDTIEYLKELERRVEELESCREFSDCETRGMKKHPDISERTSDNYGSIGVTTGRKTCINKRKAYDMDDIEAHQHLMLTKDCSTDLTVTVNEKEVFIDMRCPWRECLLLEIVDAMNNAHLDAYSVQSSTVDGVLSLTVKSKFHGMMLVSPGMIKQALYRVVGKC